MDDSDLMVSDADKKILTSSELALALMSANVRDRLLLGLLHETGCELQEIPKIKLKHISKKFIIIGSKQKRRKIKLSLSLQQTLKSYLKNHPYQQKSAFLFYTRESPTITTRRIEQLLAALGKKIGLKINPRIIRYTAIFNDLQNRMSLIDIQKKTGLDSLNNYLELFLTKGWNL